MEEVRKQTGTTMGKLFGDHWALVLDEFRVRKDEEMTRFLAGN